MDDLTTRVLRIFQDDLSDSIFWRERDGRFYFYINCNDTFAYACSDCEEITPENVDLLEQTYSEVVAITGDRYDLDFPDLFVARVRKRRPLRSCYEYYDERVRPLFDAVSPEGNPE